MLGLNRQKRIAVISSRDHVQFIDAPNGPVTVPAVDLIQAMGLRQECIRGDWARTLKTALSLTQRRLQRVRAGVQRKDTLSLSIARRALLDMLRKHEIELTEITATLRRLELESGE